MNGIINGTEMLFYPENMDDEPTKGCRKISFAELAAMGGIYASFAEVFRTASVDFSINGVGCYRAFTQFGDALVNAADGFGKRGMVIGATGIQEHARLFEIGNIPGAAKLTAPVNPAVACIGIALIAMNQKLDDISIAQREMIDLFKEDKASKLKGSLVTLNEIYTDYRNEIDNESFKEKKISVVLDIKNQAVQEMAFYRGQIKKLLKEAWNANSLKKSRRDCIDECLYNLKYYRLSIYIYSFASMLEVMLFKKLKSETISNSADRIESISIEYRELYSSCYDKMNEYLRGRFENKAKRAAAKAVRGVGKAIGSIPVIEKGSVDEMLEMAGDSIDEARVEYINKSMDRLMLQKDSDSQAFVQMIRMLDRVLNNQLKVLVDRDNLYVEAV